MLESEASKASDQIEMLQELIKCKDEVVCKLTDQLFEAENKTSQVSLQLSGNSHPTSDDNHKKISAALFMWLV